MSVILAQTAALEATAAFALFGVLALGLVGCILYLRKEVSTVREALRGQDGQNLESLLKSNVENQQKIMQKMDSLTARVGGLEQHALLTKGNLGVVRYDAFDDVSGQNSFALAIQNEEGDGVVINSIAGRESARIYCKKIASGKSEHQLSPEEEEALRSAARTPGRLKDR
ncbi:MAG: DUF4446 family protein [Fimbriimonadales bacterium]